MYILADIKYNSRKSRFIKKKRRIKKKIIIIIIYKFKRFHIL